MSPRFKMLGIHVITFITVFLGIRFIMMQFITAPNAMIIILPLVFAWVVAPRPHVIQMQTGKEYGLKWIFSKKVIKV